MLKMYLKVLDDVCTPQKATRFSAYIDLFSREEIIIPAKDTKIIKLGVKIDENSPCLISKAFKSSHYLELALRSSLALKGLIIANGIGVIDLDYQDEIGLIVYNTKDIDYKVDKGDKVAQCTIKQHFSTLLAYESEKVRTGGFGSSGER